jgi:hypothetical protein
MGNGVSMRPASGAARLAATVLLTTCAFMFVFASAALAAPPTLSIVSPPAAGSTDQQQPIFQGTSTDPLDPVTVALYSGPSVTGTPLQLAVVPMPLETGPESATWEVAPESPLAPGQYTAVAEQTNMLSETGESPPVSFTVDTAPVVSIEPISSPTKQVAPKFVGAAANGVGDDATVSVNVYEGGSHGGTIVDAGVVSRAGSQWEYTPADPLAEGTYTIVASEEDEAGGFGESPPFTFTVLTKDPVVSITSPAGEATLHVAIPDFEGSATDGPNDQGAVTVRLYKGRVASGSASEEVVQSAGGHWALVWPHELANGTYTALATQEDEAGNQGESRAVTFKVRSVLTLETSAFEKTGRSGLVSGPRPSFQGSASEASGTVTVSIYGGAVASGLPERVIQVAREGTRWATGPVKALAGGTYTVQVEQGQASEEFQFTVDATPPHVSLTSPPNGGSSDDATQTLAGAAGTEEGDIGRITIRLYDGSAASGLPLQTIGAEAVGQSWTATAAGLEPGIYTALAEQEDDVGNVGDSEAVTFAVTAPPAAPSPTAPSSSAPVASFTWFPTSPHTGESISLVSTSTDASSAITSFGWALAGNDVFSAGGSTVSTSFSTPGSHVVQMHVIDANGQSSTASEAIPVSTPVIPLMQPFPVVHVAGSFSSSGAKIGVLTVLAPVGVTVRVTCKGGGCPSKGQRVHALAGGKSKATSVLVAFPRFERSLRAGAVLDVWISDAGEIGKFTRFVIRRDKPLKRTDLCLGPAGTAPLECPTS